MKQGERIGMLLQRDVAVIRCGSFLRGILDFLTLEDRCVIAEQRNDIGLLLNQVFFSRMQCIIYSV